MKACCTSLNCAQPTLADVTLLSVGVCAVNNVLYVIGGDDGSCNLASVEFYNPSTDKWTLLPSCMSTGRSYAGQIHRPTACDGTQKKT